MHLNKAQILSTGTLEDDLKTEVTGIISLDVLPFIRTEKVIGTEVREQILMASQLPAIVAFTSVVAVETVSSMLDGRTTGWQIFCIGHATGQSVEQQFGKECISGTAENASELAGLIISAKIDRVIFFCGDHRRNDLPDQLRQNHVAVEEIVVYRTILTPKKIRRKYNGIIFFSPSAVRSFFEKNQLNDQTVLFAIGTTTAMEIANYSFNKVIVSGEPEKKALLQQVKSYFESVNIETSQLPRGRQRTQKSQHGKNEK